MAAPARASTGSSSTRHPRFQLVLSTRKEPDLALAALRAHGDLLELRADDLRFTVEEADRFLNGRQQLGLTRATSTCSSSGPAAGRPGCTSRRCRCAAPMTGTT